MGYFLGLLNGFVTSFEHRNIKLSKNTDALVVNVLRFFFASIMLCALAMFFGVFSFPTGLSLFYVLTSICFESMLAFFYVKAFQVSEQSLVGPLFGTSLVFLVPLGTFFLNERISFFSFVGVLFVIFGTFILDWTDKNNFLEILKKITQEKGVIYMLIAALNAAVCVIVIKMAFKTGIHPLSFGFWVMFGLFVLYVLLALFKKTNFKDISFTAIYAGFLFAVGAFLHYIGLNLIFATHYIVLKRTSILFDVLLGKKFGHESHFKRKSLGAIVIFLGVVLVLLF
jgi:drug/metabolite transporter (DMT)-like permease